MKGVSRWLIRSSFLCAAVVNASPTAAQSVPVVPLSPANAVLREEFSNLSRRPIRELKDGRVLITEVGNDSRFVVADFRTGIVSPVGRRGGGPGEYTNGFALYALAGDSTLMIAAQERTLLLNGSDILQTLTLSSAARSFLNGVDTLGHVLMKAYDAQKDDSSTDAIRSRQRNVSIAQVRVSQTAEPGYPRPPEVNANGATRYLNDPWKGAEQSHLFPDGWLAVARQRPYRVDWRSPDGRWTNGAPLPVPEVRVDDREKRSFMQRLATKSGAAVKPVATYPVWPKQIPPFLTSALLVATPEGQLLIPRTPTADHPETRYDVVNRNGRLERQLTLGNADRILGFGVRSVYLSTTDDDGIQRISRHPWP